MKRLWEWISNRKIRTKMLMSYMLILSLAVIAVGLLMYVYMTKIYKEQLLYSASQSFEQAEEFLDYRITSVIYVSDFMRVNENIQTILGKNQEDVETDIIGQNTDMIALENYIYSVYNSVDIYQISLYVPGYLMYANQEVLFRNLDEFQKTEDYKELEKSNESGVWLPPQELYSADANKTVEVISYLQNIRDINQLERTVGVQRVSIRSDDITTMMEKSNITNSGIVWIENSKGEVISSSNQELYFELEEGIELLREQELPKNWQTTDIMGENYFVRGVSLNKTDWKLMAALPSSELFQASSKVLKPLILVLFCLMLAVALVAVVFSRMITSRISHLAQRMESVEDTIPHLEVTDGGAMDEIGQLYQSFRYMSNRLDELMNREYENGKAVKQAELKALQAQINPHFLYNTLDLINWEALDCGAKRITKISRALAKFYKLSLNKGKEFSTVKEELEHVGYYIMIQNFRYNNRLQLIEEVPEELMGYEILHIVLQPLVENSFVHGMAGASENRVLQLRISGYAEDNDFVLQVSDNGCGMSEEQMRNILDAEKGSGYGVRNIHTRLRLVYGDTYGLEYFQNEWGGVSVRLRFPKGAIS